MGRSDGAYQFRNHFSCDRRQKDAIPEMAEAAMAVTRLMGNNPRTMTAADAVEIYEKAY